VSELNDRDLETICGGKQRRQAVDFGPTLRSINNAANAHADAAINLNKKLDKIFPGRAK
jgi:hypothetical protein